jgi:sterol 24-C-methyltransferase
MNEKTQQIIDYYHTRESLWGYNLLLNGVKHFGYYPEGQEHIGLHAAITNMMDQVGRRMDLSAGSRILDAGCGEGATTLRLADKFGFQVEGIDILDFNIERANKRLGTVAEKQPVHFQRASYQALPFAAASFDGIFTLETLVHALEPDKALKEFHRVLKPGGQLVLFEYTVPESKDMDSREEKIFRIIGEGSAMHSFMDYTHGSFENRLIKAGFQKVKVEDITGNMVPTLRRFNQLAFIPYQVVRALGLQKKFVNTTSAVELYRYRDDFRYNVITAKKV